MAASISQLPLPSPRSPPRYPDLYGKHRKNAELQILNREIGFLEEELRSVEALQPASRCCKEVNEFVGTNPDPLIPLNRKIRRSCRIWKWLRARSHFYLSWICCSSGCALHVERPHCPSCPSKSSWCCCRPRCHCHRCFHSLCCCCCYFCEKSSCSPCCVLPTLSCPDCSFSCVCPRPKCTKRLQFYHSQKSREKLTRGV
ncbi:guanine nucleotide-binding protein subunit gamma 3-like isoform X2 [Tasmannia lanceolata]|uniref:guanine nucleotide-binding protein subunit gamma 3-like isoform X2 n=1 Tax=Tasmannia lanceolata TaxID=3420 RepID=UPI004063409A